jgi:hypothetical protein
MSTGTAWQGIGGSIMKKYLLIGCSCGTDAHLDFCKVFGMQESEWTNLSFPAMGNRYISSRLFEYVDKHGAPDYVYLQYSGLNRIDLPLSPDVIVPDYDFQSNKDIRTYSEKRNWVGSGGRGGAWTANDILKRVYIYLYHPSKMTGQHDISLHEIFRGVELCKTLGIRYNWTSYYDYTNVPNNFIKGMDGEIKEIPGYIDVSHHVGKSPLNLAYEIGDVPSDECHYSRSVGEQFITRNKNKFNL